jgi:tetratricopeptide (TPR) repeat protein
MKSRLFERADWLCGAAAALIAFAVYAWTAAPSVTLLDSGEFIVAAQHFGVPHPTGYPLWTLLAWLFQLVPLGNTAWQLALFSGVCGAFAVGLAAMLIRNSLAWLTPAIGLGAQAVCAISVAVTCALSFSMWSQAVIVEVYTLHALLIGLYLTSLYAWIRRPERLAGLYASFFLLALAFSNHQLTIVYALVPLQFLVVVLLRRDLFWDLFLALLVCALLAYLSFALLSSDTVLITAAVRLGYLVLTTLAIALVLKRGRLQWRVVAWLPFVLALGLLPYLYMPFASSTNPPMNWGYTRTTDGFFASFNRSQYPGTLAELSLRIFSKVLGVPGGAAEAGPATGAADYVRQLGTWSVFFGGQLVRSFSPLCLVLFLAAIAAALRRPVAMRTWIWLLAAAFLLAMGLQPVLERTRTDNATWWLQMPYHTYTNWIFAVLCGIGAGVVWERLIRRAPALRPAIWALALLPLWPLVMNFSEASQRNHWSGWKYGRDMLANLPKGSVVFGGTDPGRFVPTYLIFGESTLPPSRRIDPAFDRRDLYILTQNGLSDRHYLAYIRDHYSADRPQPRTAFERWLGREHAYPREPLVLPTLREMQQIRQSSAEQARASGEALTPAAINYDALAGVARWIFEKNKARHTFYVEEGFEMRWSYPYAIPDGLLYRLNPTPLDRIPAGDVRKDFAFWDRYVDELLDDPHFLHDYDAQRSFSRLRLTGATLYEYRGMLPEAEKAYRQTLALWSGSIDAITGLARILWARGEFDEIIALYRKASADDPHSAAIRNAIKWAEFRKMSQGEIDTLLPQWRKNPADLELLQRLLSLLSQIGEPQKVDDLLAEALGKLGDDPRFLALAIEVSQAQNKWQQAADAATRWSQVAPDSAEARYQLSRAQLMLGNQKESLLALGAAMRLGGVEIRERVFVDPIFETLKTVPELKRLMVAPPPEAH